MEKSSRILKDKFELPKYATRVVFDNRGTQVCHLNGNPIFDRIKLEWMNFMKPQYHTQTRIYKPWGTKYKYGIFDFIRRKP